jgi:hypothetical protein
MRRELIRSEQTKSANVVSLPYYDLKEDDSLEL